MQAPLPPFPARVRARGNGPACLGCVFMLLGCLGLCACFLVISTRAIGTFPGLGLALVETPALSYRGHTAPVFSVAWSPDGQFIASAGLDKTLHVWNAHTGMLRFVSPKPPEPVTEDYVDALAWSPNGRLIAAARGGTIRVVNARDGSQVTAIDEPIENQNMLAWSPTSRELAVATQNRPAIEVWDVAQDRLLSSYPGPANTPLVSVAWSPNGQLLAAGTRSNTVDVWHVTSKELRSVYTSRSTVVYGGSYPLVPAFTTLAWSPDSQRLVAGNVDSIQVWNALSGTSVYVRYTLNNLLSVEEVAWSPDGQHIAALVAEKYDGLQVWDAASADHLSYYGGQSALAWSPDSSSLVTVGDDMNTVEVWRLDRRFVGEASLPPLIEVALAGLLVALLACGTSVLLSTGAGTRQAAAAQAAAQAAGLAEPVSGPQRQGPGLAVLGAAGPARRQRAWLSSLVWRLVWRPWLVLLICLLLVAVILLAMILTGWNPVLGLANS